MKVRMPMLVAILLFLALLPSCGKKMSQGERVSDGQKKAVEELMLLIEMPFDFSEILNRFPVSMIRQMKNRGYRYFLNQDDDVDKVVGGYVFSVFGQTHENPEFGNSVTICITKKNCHFFCHWMHDFCSLGGLDRLPFIISLAENYGRPQEIWVDATEINPDYWSDYAGLEENHLAQNLFWQLEDRKIFIRKDSVDFVIKIFLQ